LKKRRDEGRLRSLGGVFAKPWHLYGIISVTVLNFLMALNFLKSQLIV